VAGSLLRIVEIKIEGVWVHSLLSLPFRVIHDPDWGRLVLAGILPALVSLR
jgi:hypothetical protein